MYQTQQIIIKKGHKLHSYCQRMCINSKNLYNSTLFYIRQTYTAFTTDKKLHPLQQEVVHTMRASLEGMNEVQRLAYQKSLARFEVKPEDKQKRNNKGEVVKPKENLFALPTKEKPYVDYNYLDALFKYTEQPDYLSLPAQSSQNVMKDAFQNWKSFYKSLQDYKKHPSKYTGRPNIPNYCKRKEKEAIVTNQDAVIKESKYLKLPLTKERLNIGKIGATTGKLKEVRIIPTYDYYTLELVMKVAETPSPEEDNHRYMAMDLGIDNLATLVTNTGMAPILIKGTALKSINQYYNQQLAYYKGILMQGHDPRYAPKTSRCIENLHAIRFRKVKDFFHKASFHIVKIAVEENVNTIIIGKNKQWKTESNMGKKNNQSFCMIPHDLLIQMITYKAAQYGITVKTQEESYTSKASFLDNDDIPVYQEGVKHRFSGRRIKRGLYKSADGILINADVNGAYNILRKAVPTAWTNGIEGLGVFRTPPCQLRVR